MDELRRLTEQLLVECEEDEVGLWKIIWHLRHDLGLSDSTEIRQSTLRIVPALLETGDVVAGWYAPPESGLPAWQIVPWPLSTESIISRINEEWDQLGREPNIAEIVILQAKS